MITKSIKQVPAITEVEVFNLELSKEQVIELTALLGNCSSYVVGLYSKLWVAIQEGSNGAEDIKSIEQAEERIGRYIKDAPPLKFL